MKTGCFESFQCPSISPGWMNLSHDYVTPPQPTDAECLLHATLDADSVAILSTTNLHHLQENLAAADVTLSEKTYMRLDEVVNQQSVVGARYNEATQEEIDTEAFLMAAAV